VRLPLLSRLQRQNVLNWSAQVGWSSRADTGPPGQTPGSVRMLSHTRSVNGCLPVAMHVYSRPALVPRASLTLFRAGARLPAGNSLIACSRRTPPASGFVRRAGASTPAAVPGTGDRSNQMASPEGEHLFVVLRVSTVTALCAGPVCLTPPCGRHEVGSALRARA
jgi:hypothetical protein